MFELLVAQESFNEHQSALKFFQDAMEIIGIDIRLRLVDPNRLRDQVRRGDFDMYWGQWQFIDGISILRVFESGSDDNVFGYVNDDYDAIICPGVSVSPFPWAELFPRLVDGKPVENYMAWLTLTAAITVIGHPVVALPAGLDEFGMPFGLQVIGRSYADRRLLSVARVLEEGLQANPATARPIPDLDALAASTVDLHDVDDCLG